MIHGALGSRYAIGGALGRSIKRESSWLPTDIAGCALWLDFSDVNTMFVDAGITKVSSDGDSIYRINDKSGNAKHANQTVATARPKYKVNIKNGLSGGLWSANAYPNGSIMTTGNLGLSQPITFIACVNIGNRVYLYRSSSPSHYFRQSSLSIHFAGAVSYTGSADWTGVLGVVSNGASSKYINNNTSSSAYNPGSNGLGALALGSLDGSNSSGGYFFEVIVYSNLSDDNYTIVKNYLYSKWDYS